MRKAGEKRGGVGGDKTREELAGGVVVGVVVMRW